MLDELTRCQDFRIKPFVLEVYLVENLLAEKIRNGNKYRSFDRRHENSQTES